MKRLVICVSLFLFALCVSDAKASIILTYSGTFDRVGNDPAGVVGATFTWRAVFESLPYVDNGLGEPSLALNRSSSTFTVSGASASSANGEYSQPFTMSMMPRLGGAMATLPSNPPHFTRGGLRFSANVINMFGGDGVGVAIGDTPQLSHFPTSLTAPTMRALPHNSLYTVINPSISVVDDSVIPEPTTLVIWSLLGILGLSFGRRRRRRAA